MRIFRVPAGDWVRGWRLDGFGRVPGMAGRERLELEATGMESPFEQRVVAAVTPAGARVVVPDVAGGADDSGHRDQRANDSGSRRLTQIGRDRTSNPKTILVLAGTGSIWPPEWPPRPVRDIRISSLSWSPVTESNRRPSPYHGHLTSRRPATA